MKEPEAWTTARDASRAGTGKKMGSFKELFGDSRWRSRAILGVLLAFSGVVGLWGIGFFTPDLQGYVFDPVFKAEAVGPDQGSLEWLVHRPLAVRAEKDRLHDA